MKKSFFIILTALLLGHQGAYAQTNSCVQGDCKNGKGVMVLSNGDKYEGDFSDGKMNGKGMYYFKDGSVYSGQYKANRRQGYGTFKWSNGDIYMGNYDDDYRHGIGTYYYTDGRTQHGRWEKGSFVETLKKGDDIVVANPPSTPPPSADVLPKANVSWVVPNSLSNQVTASNYQVKACVKSASKIDKVELLVNGIAQEYRNYKVVTSPSCTEVVIRDIVLKSGDNELVISVTNAGGTINSEKRYITYTEMSGSTNTPPVVTTTTTPVLPSTDSRPRTALVIGNASYKNSPLKNPVNDARSMAKELENMGFEVMFYNDIDGRSTKDVVRNFGAKLREKGGVGLFYFAGHGMQVKGVNYLIPVDANIQKETDIEHESVSLDRILSEFEYAKNSMNIVILDACRNNPYARSFRNEGGGLAPVNISPMGTFIAFATSPGAVASDGDNGNGLYTQELLRAMRKKGFKIEDVFKSVRANVREKSNSTQIPWESSSIEGDFYFIPPTK